MPGAARLPRDAFDPACAPRGLGRPSRGGCPSRTVSRRPVDSPRACPIPAPCGVRACCNGIPRGDDVLLWRARGAGCGECRVSGVAPPGQAPQQAFERAWSAGRSCVQPRRRRTGGLHAVPSPRWPDRGPPRSWPRAIEGYRADPYVTSPRGCLRGSGPARRRQSVSDPARSNASAQRSRDGVVNVYGGTRFEAAARPWALEYPPSYAMLREVQGG